MRTVNFPESPKGSQMGAIEAVREASLLCFEVRQAHKTLEEMLTGRGGELQFNANPAYVRARLKAALARLKVLEGGDGS